MSTMIHLTWMETKLFFREKISVFWTFLFPILMIWLFGVMFGKANYGGISYINLYVPSWIAVNLLTTSLYTIGMTLVSYQETGVLRRYLATPVHPGILTAAYGVYGTIIFLISALFLILFGAVLFQLDLPKYPLSFLLAIFLSILALFPFGLLANSFAVNARSAAAISSVILNVMLFLSGATFPLEMMPSFLQAVAKLLPFYYVIDLLRKTWNSSPIWANGLDVGVLLGIFFLSTLLLIRMLPRRLVG